MKLKNAQSQSGFTLIELVVVVAIIGILAASILTIINPFEIQKSSRDSVRLSSLNSTAQALELFFAQNKVYPSVGTGNTFSADTVADLKNFNPRLSPTDPSGCSIYYGRSGTSGYLIAFPLESSSFTVPSGQSTVSIVAKPSGYSCANLNFTKVIAVEIRQ